MNLRRRTLTLALAAAGLPPTLQASRRQPDVQDLQSLLAPPHELAGVAAACWRAGQAPQALLLGEDGNGQPVRADTIWRVASISKLAQALVALRLHARRLIDLDRPLSEFLGFSFVHPDGHAPTGRELLSHRSGLRDRSDDGNYLPREAALAPELFKPLWSAREFTYANVNSIVLGTALEAVSGLRYDELLERELFTPLGIEAAFDPSRFSAAQRRRVATLQRRIDARLQAQTANVHAQAPAARVGADYRPGRNCAAFGPQGGLHTSLDGLMKLAEALRTRSPRLLDAAGHDALERPLWTGDAGVFQSWGSGAQRFTDRAGRDRLVPEGTGPGPLLGHLAEAYGLLGGLIVRPASSDRAGNDGWALVYLMHGLPPQPAAGRYSKFDAPEEALMSALLSP